MVTLKLARTADGFAAGDQHDRRLAITGEIANLRVQVMRSQHDAIMIGVGTAIVDDPLLTVRLPGLDQMVLRIVLDSRLRLPVASRLCATAGQFPTFALTTAAASAAQEALLRTRGVEVVRIGADAQGHVDLGEALAWLGQKGVTRVFSEGGPGVGSKLIEQGLADEVLLLTATKPLGREGLPALTPAAFRALEDSRRYVEAEQEFYPPDELRRWERRD